MLLMLRHLWRSQLKNYLNRRIISLYPMYPIFYIVDKLILLIYATNVTGWESWVFTVWYWEISPNSSIAALTNPVIYLEDAGMATCNMAGVKYVLWCAKKMDTISCPILLLWNLRVFECPESTNALHKSKTSVVSNGWRNGSHKWSIAT